MHCLRKLVGIFPYSLQIYDFTIGLGNLFEDNKMQKGAHFV